MAATRFKTAALATLGVICVSPAMPVLAQCEVATLYEPLFGSAVDIHGDYALVGNENGAGSAYFLRREGMSWVVASVFSQLSESTFGGSVALGNDYAVVGERDYSGSEGNQQGAVHVFKREGTEWVEDALITASDADWYQEFGRSVAIDGDRIVAGTVHDAENGKNAGAAYVFTRQGTEWVEEAKLLAGGPLTYLGSSVGISGDSIIVGASQMQRAYIFREVDGNWIEEASFTGGLSFGAAADIDGDYAVIGASGVYQARVLQLEDSVWTQGPMLSASDDNGFSNFGFSVAIRGDYIVVGAPEQDDDGAAYLFHRDGADWIEDYKFTPSQTSHTFGEALSLNDTFVMVTPQSPDPSVYVYTHVLGDDCNANGVSDLCDIVNGSSDDEDGSTVPDECEVCPGDANGDGTVNPLDSGFVLSQFGCTPGNELCDLADVNGDGTVDPLDVGFVLARFGDCP